VAAQAEHAHAHFASATDGRYICRRGAVDQLPAAIDEGLLSVDGEESREMEGTWSDFANCMHCHILA
jgi:hypothetical protein